MEHPDYPDIDFKAEVARYDWDQTYDVLEFRSLPLGFEQLIGIVGIPAFEVMAIDRYTPYNNVWAEDYSDYVYNLIKQFNYSPHSSINGRFISRKETSSFGHHQVLDTYILKPFKFNSNNSLFAVERAWQSQLTYNVNDPVMWEGVIYLSTLANNIGNHPIDGNGWRIASVYLEPFSLDGEKYSAITEYTVSLLEGDYNITALIYQGYKDGSIGSVPTVNQVFYKFTLDEDTEIDLNTFIKHWCIDDKESDGWGGCFCSNSIVISKKDVNGIYQQISVNTPYPFLFYADIDAYFTLVETQLWAYFANTWALAEDKQTVYASKFYNTNNTGLLRVQRFTYNLPYNALPPQKYIKKVSTKATLDDTTYPEPLTVELDEYPSSYTNLHYLKRANNNKWGGTLKQDLGSITSLYYQPTSASHTSWWIETTADSMFDPNDYNNRIYHLPRGSAEKEYSDITERVGYGFFSPYQWFKSYENTSALINLYTITDLVSTPERAMIQENAIYLCMQGFLVMADSIRASTTKHKSLTIGIESRNINGLEYRTIYEERLWEYGRSVPPVSVVTTTGGWGESLTPPDISSEKVLDNGSFLYDITLDSDYLFLVKRQVEAFMVDSVRTKEIHACLGAGEASYYNDSNGNPQPYKMHIARKLDWFAKAYGVAYRPDGSIMSTRQRLRVEYVDNDGDGVSNVIVPDGYARGQFANNKGGNTSVNNGQLGGLDTEERMGIAYQNRCNKYNNLTDDDPANDEFLKGDIILCENFLQYYESYLEDLDKGLNWQEMGSGFLPSADGNSHISFEGLGTLLAEVAYMLSSLSSNIQQTHGLALKNNAIAMELLKGLGLPVGLGTMPVFVGERDDIGDNIPMLTFPKLQEGHVSIHKRLMDILYNLSFLLGAIVNIEETTETENTIGGQ